MLGWYTSLKYNYETQKIMNDVHVFHCELNQVHQIGTMMSLEY